MTEILNAYDGNHDGLLDQLSLDTNGDGLADTAVYDYCRKMSSPLRCGDHRPAS